MTPEQEKKIKTLLERFKHPKHNVIEKPFSLPEGFVILEMYLPRPYVIGIDKDGRGHS
tara:strand:+ start:268 stop:441 length:174 start_codon:yes stop_codon:yes gene_type:complete